MDYFHISYCATRPYSLLSTSGMPTKCYYLSNWGRKKNENPLISQSQWEYSQLTSSWNRISMMVKICIKCQKIILSVDKIRMRSWEIKEICKERKSKAYSLILIFIYLILSIHLSYQPQFLVLSICDSKI